MMPPDSNLPVLLRRGTFTVQSKFLEFDRFGQSVLCKTNTRLLGWRLVVGCGDGVWMRWDVVEGVRDLAGRLSVITVGTAHLRRGGPLKVTIRQDGESFCAAAVRPYYVDGYHWRGVIFGSHS